MADGDAPNLKLQKQFNAILAEGNVLLAKRNELLGAGGGAAEHLSDTVSTLADSSAGTVTDIKKLSDVFDDVVSSGDSAEESIGDMFEGIDEHAIGAKEQMVRWKEAFVGALKDIPYVGVAAGIALDAVAKGFSYAWEMAKGLASIAKSVGEGIWNMAKAAIAIPFRMVEGLVEMAKSGGGGTELAEAYRKVRMEFGSFKESTSKNVIAAAKSMKGELANTGLSVYRVFGQLHERLEYFTTLAKELGPVFDIVGTHIMQNAEVIGAYQKGLGLAEKEMKSFAEMSIAHGKPLTEELRLIANYSLQMGEKFGISQKLISKDMGLMASSIDKFGNISQKKMSESIVYMRKLGMSVEETAGILDKYDNFETAAEGVAGLARSFGALVDPIKMMAAETGVERLDMVRKALFATGKSAENMTRRQLKALGESVGMTDSNMVRLALSSKNVGRSMDDIKKEADGATKKQLTQAEAMSKLADSIERLVRMGQHAEGGFFDQFLHGIKLGIKTSGPFLQMMFSIKRSLFEAMYAGISLGRALGNFKPIVELFRGFTDLLGPARIGKMFKGLSTSFQTFMTEFNDPKLSKGAAEKLAASLSENIQEYLDSGGKAWNKIMKAFLSIGTLLAKAFAKIVPAAMKELTKYLREIFLVLTDPAGFKVAILGDMGAAGGELLKSLNEMWGEIKKSWPELKGALISVLRAAWDKIAEYAPIAWGYLKGMFSVVWEYIKQEWPMIKDALVSALGFAWGALTTYAPVLWGYLEKALAAVWKFMKENVDYTAIGEVLLDVFVGATQFVVDHAGVISAALVAIIPTLVIGFGAAMVLAAASIGVPFGMAIGKALVWSWKKVGKMFLDAFQGIGKMWTSVVNNISSVSATAWNKIKGHWAKVTAFFEGHITVPLKNAWNSVKKAWDAAPMWFNEKLESIKKLFSDMRNSVIDRFTSAWTLAKSIWSYAAAWFDANVATPVKAVFDDIYTKVTTVWQNAWNELVRIGENGKTLVGGVFNKLIVFIMKPLKTAAELFPNIFGHGTAAAIDTMMKEWDMHSPSKVMQKMGDNIVAGLEKGITPLPNVFDKHVNTMLAATDDLSVEAMTLGKRISDNRAKVIDLKAKMADTRSGGMFGSNGSITVKRPDHTMIVNFKVTMDAGDVERVMIDRPYSKIVTNDTLTR